MRTSHQTRSTSTALAAILATVAVAAAADIHVPADHATLQGAVDAASSGDTIQIAAGVHAGQTRISEKNLTLIGQPGTVLRATREMTRLDEFISHVSILGVIRSTVHIQGITFEGEQLAADYSGPDVGNLIGAHFLDSGGSVEDCRFMGFREKTPGSEGAEALRFFNDLEFAPLVDVRVVGNTFLDNYDGILVVGAATNRSINFVITDNRISSVGPSPHEITSAGILIGAGAWGEVSGNTISGHACSDPSLEFPFSWGIIAYDLINFPVLNTLEPIRIKENTLRDNQHHVTILAGDQSIISNNSIEGTPPGTVRPAGIWASGANINITGNCFEDLEDGVLLLGDDPIYGTLLGTAVDAQITGNKFGKDVTPFRIQSMASGTETGSLLFPFPDPELNIADAIVLSWPGFYNNYYVEAAPDLEGPWISLSSPVLLHGGLLRVAVPVDRRRRFFRLRKP